MHIVGAYECIYVSEFHSRNFGYDFERTAERGWRRRRWDTWMYRLSIGWRYATETTTEIRFVRSSGSLTANGRLVCDSNTEHKWRGCALILLLFLNWNFSNSFFLKPFCQWTSSSGMHKRVYSFNVIALAHSFPHQNYSLWKFNQPFESILDKSWIACKKLFVKFTRVCAIWNSLSTERLLWVQRCEHRLMRCMMLAYPRNGWRSVECIQIKTNILINTSQPSEWKVGLHPKCATFLLIVFRFER